MFTPGLFRPTYFTPVCQVHTAERLCDARTGKKPSFSEKNVYVLKFFLTFLGGSRQQRRPDKNFDSERTSFLGPIGLRNFSCHKTHKLQLKYGIEHEISI